MSCVTGLDSEASQQLGGDEVRQMPAICWGIVFLIAGTFLTCLPLGHAVDVPQDNAKQAERSLAPYETLPSPEYAKMTGIVPRAVIPMTEPAMLWKVSAEFQKLDGQTSTYNLSDPVVADGILYFGDDHGNLTALRAKDQQEVWNYEYGARIATTPSVDESLVYFGSMKGIIALRRDNGQVAWQFEIPDGAAECTPLPIGDAVYVSGYNGHLYRLRKSSGQISWDHDFVDDAPDDQPGFNGARARIGKAPARPSGSSSDGKLLIQSVFDQSRVIAVDCETGTRRWAFQTHGWVGPSPTIANERVYVVSQDKHLYCLDLQSGHILWTFETPSWLASRVAVHDGSVFLPHHRSRLYQLDAATGNLIRIMEPPDESDRKGNLYSFPLIANHTACFACGNGLLFAFDIESGAMRWKLQPFENAEFFSSPSTDGHQLFVTSRRTSEGKGENAIVSIGIAP